MIIDYNISFDEVKQGYQLVEKAYRCLFCEQEYIKGDIYSFGERLVKASTAIVMHLEEKHGSVFETLLQEDKKNTGLTNIQKELLSFFYNGLSDREIANKTDTSPSTVRFQRFNLKEKARQAKVLLALYELMEDRIKDRYGNNIHKGATMIDLRYNITEEEAEKIINTFFTSLEPLVLSSFSSKEKKKIVILRVIAERFERGRRYREKEVNDILRAIYDDYVTIRRYLIEYGFMDRTQDCKEYWLK